jgi:YebC/PmpR family DNA-binding regulatory protein
MGRHATVAGRQASSASARSRAFTKVARELAVAAKLGGSDPNSNPRLRLAMDHAREVNMSKDTVERAVKKGAGELEGMVYEEALYEGYGPGGTAVMIDVLTDNRNRTNPELKRIFQKNGANMAEQGAVAWMFKRRGVIDVSLQGTNEDAVMETSLDAGAEDVQIDGDMATIFTEPQLFAAVRANIEKSGLKIERSGLEMVPDNTVAVSGDDAKAAWTLINALEDQDDVQHVYHNAEFSEEDLAKF